MNMAASRASSAKRALASGTARVDRVAMLLGLGVYLAQVPLYWSYFTDDSYIYARMALNLAQRGQLVFNPGEWVNAATSPLWALVGAAGAWAGLEPLMVYKLLGWTAGALAVLLFTRAAGRWLPSRSWRILASLLFAVEPWFVRWSGSGLETSLGALVLAAVLDLAGRPSREIPRAWLGLVLGLGALVRPELLLLGALLGARIVFEPGGRGRIRFVIAWTLPVLLWSGIAYHFYGAVIPATLQAKSTPIGLRPQRFLHNLRTLLGLILVAVPLSLVGGPVFLRRFLRRENRTWLEPVLLLWLLLLPAAYLIKDVTLVSRYLEILLPALLYLSLKGLVPLRWQTLARGLAGIEIVAALWLSVFWIAPSMRAYSSSAQVTLGRIGDWLRENTPKGDRVAIYDIGLVGYRSQRTVLDLGGLVHPGINQLRDKVDDEVILRQGLFLRFGTPQWLVDRRDAPRSLDGEVLGHCRLEAILDGEVYNLGLTRPDPVYYTLYRLVPIRG